MYCLAAIATAAVAVAQAPANISAQDTQNVLKVLDQLTEQNKKLAQQNRELMEQVDMLRQRLAASPDSQAIGGATQASATQAAAASPTAAAPPQAETSRQMQPETTRTTKPCFHRHRMVDRVCLGSSTRAGDSQ